MHFAFTEDQQAINEAARSMLEETCQPADLRTMLAEGRSFDETRWDQVVAMGLPGMLAPVDCGGLGLGMADFIAIAEAAGYVALPEPLVELAGITVPLLAMVDGAGERLRAAIGGEYVALVHPANPHVTHCDRAKHFVFADGMQTRLVDRSDVTIEPLDGFDALRPLSRVSIAAGGEAVEGAHRTADRGALLAAAQMVGIGQRCIDMAVAYAKERTQFGKAIGTYQAVKHLAADAQVAIEFARPVVYAAAAEFDQATLASRARIAHAKIAAGEAADLATRNALQIFGAMGYTREADLHFWLKRAHGLHRTWGTVADHMATVAERIAALPTGADTTFAGELA